MRRAAVLFAILLAGCAAPNPPADESTLQEVTLAPGSFFLALVDLASPSRVRVEIDVLEGGPVDAWLADRAACDEFTTPAFAPAATALQTLDGALDAELPAGRACVPIENSGASPAVARYHVQTWRL